MRRPLLIGLAGGVGSGKSAVARELEKLGCVVSDSDAEAKSSLRLPGVRDELVSWWGERVLGADGEIDRAAVASIVFSDDAERARLEGLVHPKVHAARERTVAEAAAIGAPAVVVDAPLLFEAGIDGECDAVIFVDTPRAVRLERVRATRGWDEAELARREAAQMPLEQKRKRSTEVVWNGGPPEELAAAVRGALERILGKAAGS